METKNIKKAFCLTLILSLVLGWWQGDGCRAEELEQPIFIYGIKYEENDLPEIADNRTIKRTPIETKSEKMGPEKTDILIDYVLPISLGLIFMPIAIIGVPLEIAGRIICYIVYGTSCGIR